MARLSINFTNCVLSYLIFMKPLKIIIKATKYHPLINHLHSSYSTVTFVNLSMSATGILGTSSEFFLSMLTDLQLDDKAKKMPC